MGATLETAGTSVPPPAPDMVNVPFSVAMAATDESANTRSVRRLTIEQTVIL
jgi:hypothetical protein